MADTGPNVLVVDDLEDNRNILRRHLKRFGCRVSLAENGQEALNAIRETDHELILLDLMMPVVDGFTVIEKVRADAEGRQPPIIAISARHDTDAITRALDMGANDYVTKPYDFPVVWARIEKQLNAARSMSLIREVNTRLMKRLTNMRKDEGASADASDNNLDELTGSILSSAQAKDLPSKLNHEIRTRLHQILGLSQQIQSYELENATAEEIAQRFRHIEKSGLGLLGLLEDLNNYLALRQGLDATAFEEINVRNTVLREWELLGSRIDTGGAKFEFFTDNPAHKIRAHPYFAGKAIAAILSNAVKFTKDPPSLKVHVNPYAKEFCRVTVEDNGVGVPSAAQHEILAPFFQRDNGLARNYEGLGLGLAIANQIMTAHNGDISIEDSVTGRGLAVHLTFPWAPE